MPDQTRIVSFVEVCLNTAIGFAVSFVLWPPVAMVHDLPYSYSMNFTIPAIFTVASIARGYVIRRFFANKLHEVCIRMAKAYLTLQRERDRM